MLLTQPGPSSDGEPGICHEVLHSQHEPRTSHTITTLTSYAFDMAIASKMHKTDIATQNQKRISDASIFHNFRSQLKHFC